MGCKNIYIGSSYGTKGIENRNFKNHFRKCYRKEHKDKELYKVWETTGTVVRGASLALFENEQPMSLVPIAEAIMVSCSVLLIYKLIGMFVYLVYRKFSKIGD